MRKILLVLGLLATFTGLSFASLPMQFSGPNISYFGDSLTDMGNNTDPAMNVCLNPSAPVTNRTGGSLPDRTWADMSQFGFGATPSNHPVNTNANGIDYAFSGATVSPNVQICSPVTGTCIPSQHSIYVNQIQPIMNSHANYGPNHLVVVWGGANDILDTFAAQTPKRWSDAELQAQLQTIIAQDMAYFTGIIINMYYNNGVRNFLFIGMPNLADAPIAADNNVNPQFLLGVFSTPEAKQALINISLAWNNTLVSQVLEPAARNRILPGIHIYYFNPFFLLNNIIANPNAFGFAQSTQAVWCLNENDNPDSYMFFNYIHPTTALHAIIARDIREDAFLCNGSTCGNWS